MRKDENTRKAFLELVKAGLFPVNNSRFRVYGSSNCGFDVCRSYHPNGAAEQGDEPVHYKTAGEDAGG